MAKRTPPLRPGHAKRIAALGDRLRTARLARAMSQANLAERVGVDRTTIGKLEAGDAGTSLSTVLRVLSALGLENDIDQLAAADVVGTQLAAHRLRRPAPRRKPTGSTGPYAGIEPRPAPGQRDVAETVAAYTLSTGDAASEEDRYRLVSRQPPPRIATPGAVGNAPAGARRPARNRKER